MDSTGLILLGLLGALLWFWISSLRIRELAIATARETCRRGGVQLLDATVVLRRLAVQRAPTGRLHLRRTFVFAYSENGDDRQTGFIISLGNHIVQVGL